MYSRLGSRVQYSVWFYWSRNVFGLSYFGNRKKVKTQVHPQNVFVSLLPSTHFTFLHVCFIFDERLNFKTILDSPKKKATSYAKFLLLLKVKICGLLTVLIG